VKRWRRTEIRVERREILIFRSEGGLGAQGESRCIVCGEPVALVRAEDAAAALGVEPAAVQRWLEEGRVHGRASPEGKWMICAGSFRREM
jgi:hypothetical protein